jgi:hypothetical protein
VAAKSTQHPTSDERVVDLFGSPQNCMRESILSVLFNTQLLFGLDSFLMKAKRASDWNFFIYLCYPLHTLLLNTGLLVLDIYIASVSHNR